MRAWQRYLKKHVMNEKLLKSFVSYIIPIISIVIALLLVYVSFLQLQVNDKLADSNEKLTNITTEYYRYHPPEVSVIQGYVGKLLVFSDGNRGTYITILGLASVYNNAQSDDIALVRVKNFRKSIRGYGLKTHFNIEENHKIPDDTAPFYFTVIFEGNSFSIPVIPGNSPKEIPLIITLFDEFRDLNINHANNKNNNMSIIIDELNIEVVHPNNKEIMENLTVLKPIEINYTIGQNKAQVKSNDGKIHEIIVKSTQNKEIYDTWKLNFLSSYGSSSFII